MCGPGSPAGLPGKERVKIRKKKVLSELVLERYRVLTTFKDVPTPVYHNLILIFLILI